MNQIETKVAETGVKMFIRKFMPKSWRSFCLGLAGALFAALLPIIQTGHFNIKTDWPSLVQAAGIALFGYVCKDAKVTGLPTDTPLGAEIAQIADLSKDSIPTSEPEPVQKKTSI